MSGANADYKDSACRKKKSREKTILGSENNRKTLNDENSENRLASGTQSNLKRLFFELCLGLTFF